MEQQTGTFAVKKGLAQMLKGGVIMDVVTPEHAGNAAASPRSTVTRSDRLRRAARGWRRMPRMRAGPVTEITIRNPCIGGATHRHCSE